MLTIDGVSKTYKKGNRFHSALCDVTLHLDKGEVLGLVGESGAGKSTLGRCILGLERPDCGRIVFQGIDLARLGRNGFYRLYPRIQMIFQDPRTHLNPWMRVGDLIREPLACLTTADRIEQARRVGVMMEQVGLPPEIMGRYPHEISGGQCQRVAIARSLIIEPELLVCDEALSAQDAPLQLQILNLLRQLIQEMKLTCLFITHDLVMARYFCSRIAVIREGRIVEQGKTRDIFAVPADAYTRMLISSCLKLSSTAIS